MARFDQVITEDCHPEAARRRILAAAKKFDVDAGDFEKIRHFRKQGAS
jgi:hypothetical protein